MVCEKLHKKTQETKGHDSYNIGTFSRLIALLIELRDFWKTTILIIECFKLN